MTVGSVDLTTDTLRSILQSIDCVVVYAVVRQWVVVMVEGAEERGERGQEGRHQNALFYADDGMVA